MAIEKNYDSIKYIEKPCEEVQLAAVNISYDALRYINNPSEKAEISAIRNNEAAIKFVHNLDKEKMIKFLKENILVIKYLIKDISIEELEGVLKERLSSEDIEESYVRNFINCESINKKYNNISMDKIVFIHKYGSSRAKRVAIDEKLKIM